MVRTCGVPIFMYVQYVMLFNLFMPEFLKWTLRSLNFDKAMFVVGISVKTQKENGKGFRKGEISL